MTKDIDLAKFLTQERHDIHLVGVAGSGFTVTVVLAQAALTQPVVVFRARA